MGSGLRFRFRGFTAGGGVSLAVVVIVVVVIKGYEGDVLEILHE